MQSRLQSVLETSASTVIGFCVSWAATLVLFPLFGWKVTAGSSFGVTLCYTILSLVRGYFVRRLFNRLHKRSH